MEVGPNFKGILYTCKCVKCLFSFTYAHDFCHNFVQNLWFVCYVVSFCHVFVFEHSFNEQPWMFNVTNSFGVPCRWVFGLSPCSL